ncbi:hypothetical protein D3C87_1075680 [compost metagenome]
MFFAIKRLGRDVTALQHHRLRRRTSPKITQIAHSLPHLLGEGLGQAGRDDNRACGVGCGGLGGCGSPPLPCRASPPQGGRSTCGKVSPISTFEKEVAKERLADLPTCGGDARQGRGGEPHAQTFMPKPKALPQTFAATTVASIWSTSASGNPSRPARRSRYPRSARVSASMARREAV